jgi:hypothetical protein
MVGVNSGVRHLSDESIHDGSPLITNYPQSFDCILMSLTQKPIRATRISFGMIVLNGEPFTKYNLRSLYPWAHEIIVVEGACTAAAAVATSEGHSIDDTLEVLRRFKRDEDPENKISIVTAEDMGYPNGFWPGEKHEMSQAYANRATGNYLWQVDMDEFYREEDLTAIVSLLDTGISQISFPMLQFWGGIGIRENGEYLSLHFTQINRIFAWGKEHRYTTHRPPTVVDENGTDLRQLKWLDGPAMRRRNIFVYHYCMLLPKQVRQKSSYYSRVDWSAFQQMEAWAERAYFKFQTPFAVCDVLHYPMSWLEEYRGSHPAHIIRMVEDIEAGIYPNIELRRTDDIMRVIRRPQYRVGRFARKSVVTVLPFVRRVTALVLRFARILPFYIILRNKIRAQQHLTS